MEEKKDDLDLVELLPLKEWREAIGETLRKQANVSEFIGKERNEEIIPERKNTFAALKEKPPYEWNVIICMSYISKNWFIDH